MKKSKPNPKANRNILWFVYAAVFLFLAMGIYLGYFLVVKSDTVIDNPYNARATIFEDRVTRGKILADDGTVLARTVTATGSDGTETREYHTAVCLPMWWGIRRWERPESSRWQTLTSCGPIQT